MTDDLGDLILGTPTKTTSSSTSVQPTSPKGSYSVNPKILDNLRATESGGDPIAVNKETNALGAYQFMPTTVQMLHKQGIKFNPFDEQESRSAAEQYLGSLIEKNNGDVRAALAQYGGFKTKDPSAYVNKVLKGVDQTTQPAQTTTQSTESDDPLGDLILNKPTPQPVYQSIAGAGRGSYAGYNAAQEAAGKTRTSPMADMQQKINQSSSSLGALGEAGLSLVSGAVAPLVAAPIGVLSTLGSGKYGTSEGIQAGERTAAKVQQGLTYQPKTEQGQELVGKVAKVMEDLHIPPSMIPEVAGFGPLAGAAATQLKGQFAQKTQVPSAKISEAIQPVRNVEPIAQSPGVQTVAPDLTGVGAAKSNMNPYSSFTGEESARGPYPTIKTSKIAETVPEAEQKTRAQIAQEITGNDKVRTGVVTGNENDLRNEYTEAKQSNQTPSAELLRRQIAEEQNGLTNYARQRIENTGADQNLVTDYERGQRINDAFAGDDGLTGFFKQEKQKLYDEAKAKVGDNPINTTHVNDLLADPQFRASLGLKGNESVANSAEQLINLAKTVGFKDEFGTVHPANSISAWDAVRKSLNNEWTKDNASVIRKINQSIDQDVAAAGGGDLYKRADNLHKAEKTLFESKGIKTLFGNIDSNGVELATPYEQIPKKLNGMTIDQWKHIHDVADSLSRGQIRGVDYTINVPPELQAAAKSAKNEILGNIAREIYESGANKAGVWNQNSANKIMNARAEKLKYFDPVEQQAFHTLNIGGHIMPGVHAYEGAALQAQRMGMLTSKLPTIGREIGAATHIPFAATVLEKGGEKLQELSAGKSAVKQATELEKKMKQNAAKGSKLSDIGKK
jgi:hypothetical protein